MAQPRSDWVLPAVGVVALVTALRWVLLAFDRTDLFVDESQYWLWGQSYAFGYFSKPPLIAWLIGTVTTLAGSDGQFWIRMPGAALHGGTALILGAIAARLHSPRAAFWVAGTYVTLPFAALGGLMISTDTVMAPFFAAALLFHLRLTRDHRWQDAILTGVMLGLACLAKYAGIYFLTGAVVAAILHRDLRPSVWNWLVLLVSFAVVMMPNILWNQSHNFATVAHTVDNVGWIEGGHPLAQLQIGDALKFLASQIGVFGPVTLAALIVGLVRRRTLHLAAFVVPVLAIVTLQAVLDDAYANWALTAYFAGTIIATVTLLPHPGWQVASLATNGAICLALPLLTVFPQTGPDGAPLLARYLGRAEMSLALIAMAKATGAQAIVASDRDVIADLFYTGRDARIAFYTPRPTGQPDNHYEQSHAVPPDLAAPVLYVARKPPRCPAAPLALPHSGAYSRAKLAAYLVSPSCLPTTD